MLEQRTDEWFQARCGKVTASRIADLTAKTKSGWGASRANYMAQLIAERLTGTPAETYSNSAMQWGTDTEPQAIDAYQFYMVEAVEPAGFETHPDIAESGASPDGFVGKEGLIEVKCPNTATHLDTLIKQTVPAKYIKQMQWQMACTGRKWCDFASFDPRLPEHLRLWVQRVERDDKMIEELQTHVRDFIEELKTTIGQLPPDPAIEARKVMA